jgi:ethanolamine utilization microcompartment shell protein EutS
MSVVDNRELVDNRAASKEELLILQLQVEQLQLGEIPELDELGDRVVILEGQVISISGELAQEISDRQAGDSTLQGNIDVASANLAQEVLDREAGDNALSLEIDAVESALAQEILDRQAGDNTLSGEIDAIESALAQEILDRQSGDNTLSGEIDAVEAAIAQEIADRQAGDAAVSLEVDAVEIALAQEVLDRQAGDAAVSLEVDAVESALAAEVINRQEADNVLSGEITAVEAALAQEALDRQLEDAQTLADAQGYADSLFAAVSGDVDGVEAALAQEILGRQAGDSNLQDQIDDLDTFTQAIQSDVDDLETLTAAIVEDVDNLESGLAQEILDRQAGDSALDGKINIIETFGYDQVLYVSKNGSDTNSGKQHSPFLTITAAQNLITDASPTKRYVIKVMPGSYTETSLALKANVFIVGEGNKEATRITGPVSLASDFSGSGDHRSGFHRVTLLSAADFNWATVTSAAGKLYISETVFASTLNMYGHNNTIAQAQFSSCIIFGAFTVSGINVGVFTDNICYGNITLNQHPNGGMVTTISATGGYCGGTFRLNTTVNDFNRRSSCFLRSFHCGGLIADGPSSYADYTIDSEPKVGATSLNGGNLVPMNPLTLKRDLSNLVYPTAVNYPIMPANSSATNLGDWNKQWAWHFAYVHASTGTDCYMISYGPSFAADSTGRSIGIYADGAGLQPNVNGGNIALGTAAVSGTGVRGKIQLDGREIDVTSKKIVNVANGEANADAVNKSQLDGVSSSLSSGLAQEILDRQAADLDLQDQIDDLDTFTQAIQSDLDDVETLANANASAIDALEEIPVYQFHTMSVLVASSTEQQYVDCVHIAVDASLSVHVDPMKAHITRDFTTSIVDGKTRITWVNTFAIGGIEEVAIGETIYLSYNYEV